MGTRGLTAVYHDGAYRVAQYGQWDHYPEGQGVKALEFCQKWLKGDEKTSQFMSNLATVRFCNDEDRAESERFSASIGCANGWMDMRQAELWKERYPYWSRDLGASILDAIADPLPGHPLVLRDSLSFAADSLFCEFAYVIDLDAYTLEVFKGFNKSGVDEGRFADLPFPKDRNASYGRVRPLATFDLNCLPNKSTFLEILNAKMRRDEDEA